MELYSTNNRDLRTDLKTAVMQGLAADRGLYMPVSIPRLPESFISNLPRQSFRDIAYTVARTLFSGALPDRILLEIIEGAINFPVPLVQVEEDIYVAELFHGPSLAFKDFGARFMAGLMGYFNRGADQPLTILVATSGDTGGAVAAGFLGAPGIRVVILYPAGKVSELQEKQLTTLGENITAIEIEGTFDDCQALVKQAFLDRELNQHLRLSSANSINIARLIPQTFYYFEAYKQLSEKQRDGRRVVFSVPSGNFGNLTAGLLAWRMGLPVHHFIAATNINDVVPEYLVNGIFSPRPSEATLSNAMDVGDPSNFYRLIDLFYSVEGKAKTWEEVRKRISGYAFTDQQTADAIRDVLKNSDYLLDPHGAVGYLALRQYLNNAEGATVGIVLETAHPAKFEPAMESITGHPAPLPEALAALVDKEKLAYPMRVSYPAFREFLIDHFKE
jgi:threonine synthase